MGSETYHEPYEVLSAETREMHRAIVSLMEELEAIDWYQQRMDGCTDDELREILRHNKDEEIEHAMMTLEWIRRRSPEFDHEMRTYLFTDVPILRAEEEAKGATGEDGAAEDTAKAPGARAERDASASDKHTEEDHSLRIRSLRT
ncbi:MAG: ferritin-like domain-containing protein [Euryarchaeota archaeon]|nr:ferritin-like domain-containing protein [Euryarchaeota archaeon]